MTSLITGYHRTRGLNFCKDKYIPTMFRVLCQDSKIILFGGRDNDTQRPHNPRTCEIINDEGSLHFKSYDEKPVRENFDPNCKPIKSCIPLQNSKSGNTEACTCFWEFDPNLRLDEMKEHERKCGYAPVGLCRDDVWIYDLKCERYADLHRGWEVLHSGETFGGCRFEKGVRACNNDIKCTINWPKARAGHSVIYDKERNAMWLFGGHTMYYPYPSDSKRRNGNNFRTEYGAPYPTYPYFLDDLWVYNISTGYWEERISSKFIYAIAFSTINMFILFFSVSVSPSSRMDCDVITYSNILILLSLANNNLAYNYRQNTNARVKFRDSSAKSKILFYFIRHLCSKILRFERHRTPE